MSSLAQRVGEQGEPAPVLPRLLDGAPGAPVSLAAHLERHGPLPEIARDHGQETLLRELEASGLTGRGGAGFPAATKLRAVARGHAPVVVANGTEGEPASAKDKTLIACNPHLVVDGAVAAAYAVGSREAILAVGRADRRSQARLEHALGERAHLHEPVELRVVAAPDRFVSGEESALVHWLDGGPAKPTTRPPRSFERGVRGRPTLVQNVETLANIALIARRGAAWFRTAGTAAEPGTALVTVRGAVRAPGVAEVELGPPLRDVLHRFGGLTSLPRALLVGGYFGTWIDAREALELPLTEAALGAHGAALGARTIVVLPQDRCGLVETARVARYLAAESAGQCGSCLFGLAAIAAAVQSIATGAADAPHAHERLHRLAAQVAGRGACAHPTGATRFVESALRVFADEAARHLRGRCCTESRRPLLPAPTGGPREWR